MKILDKKIEKEKPKSMFNELYEFLSDKIGEDIALKILRLTGIVPLKFELDYWGGFGLEYNIRTLISSYNLMSFNYKKIRLEKRIRNIIFRKNIKIRKKRN